MSKLNADWHRQHKLSRNASPNERLQWHVDHARECGCRPMPPSIAAQLKARKPKLVVGVLVRHGDKFLLARETLEGGKDWWIVPGGKVEFGETLEDAAKREILEETGIVAADLKFLAYKEAIAAEVNYHTVIFFFETRTNSQKVRDDVEGKVIEAKWFTKAEALKLPLVFSAEWLLTEIVQ